MNKPSNVTAQNVAVQETNKESDAVMPSKQETQTEKAAVGLVFKSKPRNIRKSFNTEDE